MSLSSAGLFLPEQGSENFKLVVYCVDGGTPRQTSTTTVVVTYTAPSTTLQTTTYSTTTEKDIWQFEAFRATFGTLVALLGIFGFRQTNRQKDRQTD